MFLGIDDHRGLRNRMGDCGGGTGDLSIKMNSNLQFSQSLKPIERKMVGESRFELPTSCSQGRRANQAALLPDCTFKTLSQRIGDTATRRILRPNPQDPDTENLAPHSKILIPHKRIQYNLKGADIQTANHRLQTSDVRIRAGGKIAEQTKTMT
jgi:hypothetical protein